MAQTATFPVAERSRSDWERAENILMMTINFLRGYVYILQCADGSYYTGSTQNLMQRLLHHQNGRGSNYTAKRLPVRLVYFESYARVDVAFKREKQIQGWCRKKKEALIDGQPERLHELASCKNSSHFEHYIL